jgi:lysophospholipase L1-like esterase
MIAMGIVMLGAGLPGVLRARKPDATWPRRLLWIGEPALWITWAVMAVDWHAASHCSRPVTPDPTRPVVCLGDSLTAGVSPHGGYPEDLGKLITLPVVNLGQDGITSADVLQKLPALAAAKPQGVVVELGGHDFLKGCSRASTKANLTRIIEAFRKQRAEVVLMEIPRGLISDPYAGLERELAREYDLELVSDTPIRKLVLWSPYAPPGRWVDRHRHLSDDGLHANARGNEVLARYVADALARLFGPEILASPNPSRPGRERRTSDGIER